MDDLDILFQDDDAPCERDNISLGIPIDRVMKDLEHILEIYRSEFDGVSEEDQKCHIYCDLWRQKTAERVQNFVKWRLKEYTEPMETRNDFDDEELRVV